VSHDGFIVCIPICIGGQIDSQTVKWSSQASTQGKKEGKMKEIPINNKFKVIKLFLGGVSYDEIAQQAGIAKGSVVNIINEFRDGYLPAPPGMAEYIDELRHVAVDLKKHATTITQLELYLKIHVKLKEMGVGDDQVEMWLDICQGIASPTVSNNQFVAAALELAEATSKNGPGYKSVVQDYSEKLKLGEILDAENQQKKEEIVEHEHELKEKKEQAAKELDSINKAMVTAQENFAKQKSELKAELKQYLAENQLDWQKANAAVALLNSGLTGEGLNQGEVDDLSKQIAAAGSLLAVTKQLKEKKDALDSEVGQLGQDKDALASSVEKLGNVNQKLCSSIFKKGQEKEQLDAEIETRTSLVNELRQTMSLMADDLYVAHLIITFLFNPSRLSSHDLDQLVALMVGLREKRLGVGPKQVKDASGNIICECQMPEIRSSVDADHVDTDQVREQLAFYLMPLVKDKFVSKWDYEVLASECVVWKARARG